MKTEWDYTELADAYLKRPEYAPQLLEELFSIAGLGAGDRVCDIGAGVAHLTIPLAKKQFVVDAVEPNDAMRKNGIARTRQFDNVTWYEGTGEATGMEGGIYDFVCFGSSFNVCDRDKAMQEVVRLLKSGKWFTCMWNHRDLTDPIQSRIEAIIASHIPGYGYGTRRESQIEIIQSSGLFQNVQELTGQITHTQSVDSTVEAWRSHGTLHRQAGDKFDRIIAAIEEFLRTDCGDSIVIPYTTRASIAQKAS